MQIRVNIKGDTKVIAGLKELGPRAELRLAKSTAKLALNLQKKVVRDKLNGQVLQRPTGTLARSIDQLVLRRPGGSTGIVGTNVEYARKHEYGFKGTETVKQHLREIKKAWGRSITPREVMVRQHVRAVNFPERSFLRSSLAEMTPEILAEYEKAVDEIVKEAAK